MKRLVVLLVTVALMLTTGVALAENTFTVPFSALGNSGVEGSAVLTAAGEGTDISLDITGLTPGASASATLHAGTCEAPSASLATLPALTADASGKATASGQVLFRGTEGVALAAIADGEHVMFISQAGQTVACAWIPEVETVPTVGMPRTGGADLLLALAGLSLVGIVALGSGLVLRRQH
ncbi:MAG: hypothetical protein M3441_17280 [Chloroflexota bacterium]|nr:hypothetical protein [Chloroflexota bacterium]